mmetsp:Transcript_13465/g.28136  ORF Transcript_13465/g.28136 Transcript_13465/m.28136 type:complete len:162 (+) Transcript_13465:180-665(+)
MANWPELPCHLRTQPITRLPSPISASANDGAATFCPACAKTLPIMPAACSPAKRVDGTRWTSMKAAKESRRRPRRGSAFRSPLSPLTRRESGKRLALVGPTEAEDAEEAAPGAPVGPKDPQEAEDAAPPEEAAPEAPPPARRPGRKGNGTWQQRSPAQCST